MKIIRRLLGWGMDSSRPVSLSATTGILLGIIVSLRLTDSGAHRLLILLGGLALGIASGWILGHMKRTRK